VFAVEYAIEFGGDPQDVTITQRGAADLRTLRQFNAELMGHPRYRGGMLILFENSSLDLSGLSDIELEQTAIDVIEREWNASPRAVAIIALDPETHARERQIVAHLGGSRSRRRIFTSREAAVAWLREQRD
jgi:hypothetical protein